MQYNKPPLTFEQQLELLESRQMLIIDRDQALHTLECISYYRLSAYWHPPVTPTNRRLFAVLLILRRIMGHHHDGTHWQERVTDLIEPMAEKYYWRTAMGLPDDWKTHPLCNRTV